MHSCICIHPQAGKDYRTGANVRAVNPNIFSQNQSYEELFAVIDGSIENFTTNSKKAVVGTKIAELLGLKVGDTFRLITTKNTNKMITPKVTSFEVAAIISSGYQERQCIQILCKKFFWEETCNQPPTFFVMEFIPSLFHYIYERFVP